MLRKAPYRSEREFGLTVGGVFLGLGGWWLWGAKKGLLASLFLGLGFLLMLLGAAFPKALVGGRRVWMALAEVLGVITTSLILAVVFFGVILPIGTIKKLRGWDPLRRRATPSESYWQSYSERQRDKRHYENMF
jgi:hypothetical protein